MRIAALYDIHGNLPALEAVLDEVQRESVHAIVAGGDILSGPMQAECLELLRAFPTPVHYISGNCEREVIAARHGKENGNLPPFALELLRWSAHRLSAGQEQSIACWPRTFTIEMPCFGRVLFCHATPRSDDEIFTARTDEAVLAPIFEPANADVVVCGHTHMQFDRTIGTKRVVNAGSVGMPFGSTGADWLLLGPDIELRHTLYDRETAARRIAATGFPNSAAFDMLHPPAAEKMLDLYSRAELKI